MASGTRGPYRAYIFDSSVPVPRTTDWRNRKRKRDITQDSQIVDNTEYEDLPSTSNADDTVCETEGDMYITGIGDIDMGNDSLSELDADDSKSSHSIEGDEFDAYQDNNQSGDNDPSEDIDESVDNDEEIADEQIEENNEDMFVPLYPGANVTVCGAYCAIMHLQSKCRLSFSTLGEVLMLLQLLCPQNSKLPRSVYILRKFFCKVKSQENRKTFCPNCHNEIEGKTCSTPDCTVSTSEPDVHVFIQLDITAQLRTILSRHLKDIQCFSLSSQDSNLSGITMLSHAKEFFSSADHIGVIINTDGVALYKSSRVTMWPVYLEIANFSPSIRFRQDNMVVCALWVGRSKPDMNILLKPTLQTINQLNVLGFTFSEPGRGVITIRVKLLFAVFDLIAKAKILNMTQFNGWYGCPTCLHPGVHQNNRHLYLPYSSYPLRTMASIENALEQVEKKGVAINGIKGLSPLHNYLDLVNCVPTDYMHGVLEGVTKALLVACTSTRNRRKPFSIRSHLDAIDKILCLQTPPHEFTRSPRSISSELSYWKASEFRYWLLFYSLPLLVNVLPPLYLHHMSLLVCAMHILLSKDITVEECCAAEEMLLDFYHLLPELYGDESCTMNAHSLTHLPHYVKLWGPCWTHSAFSFESHNGTLKRAVHSTRKVAEQLSFCLNVKLTLQKIYHDIESKESQDCLHFLGFQRHAHSSLTKLQQGYAIGAVKTGKLNTSDYEALKRLCPLVQNQVMTFKRLLYNDMMFHTAEYRNGEGKRCSAFCCFTNADKEENYGEIQAFAECSPVGTVAFIKPCKRTGSSILETSGLPCRDILETHAQYSLVSRYIIEINSSSNDRSIAVNVKNITFNCICVKARDSSKMYIVKVPNNFEHF